MKKFLIAAVLSTTILASGSALALGQYASGTTGADIGWPNCSAQVPIEDFGIVGVSDGTGYTTSPCLYQESTSFSNNLSLYVNTGWYNKSSYVTATSPKICASGDNNCLAYNYGYNAGVYAYNAASKAGVHSATWWLDVETSNTWNKNVVQNQNSLQGEYDALTANGATTVGIYSTTVQWQTITGGWQNNWPSWGATTWTTAAQAKTYCTGHQFTGGPSYLMQFKAKRATLDQDVAC